jgi:hypothetical protein
MYPLAALLLCALPAPAAPPEDLSGLHPVEIAADVPGVANSPLGFVELRQDWKRPEVYHVRALEADGTCTAAGTLTRTRGGAAVRWALPTAREWHWSARRRVFEFGDANGFVIRVVVGGK